MSTYKDIDYIKRGDISVQYVFSIVNRKDTRPEAFEALAKSPSSTFRRDTAESKYAPIHVLRQLANDEDEWVAEGVARNSRVTPELLTILAKRSYTQPDVVWLVAQNTHTPSDIIEYIMNKYGDKFIVEVAHNSNTPSGLIERFVTHPDERVRSAVAGNPSLSIAFISQLSDDPSELVRYKVAMRLFDIATEPGNRIDISPILLTKLANDTDESTRSWIASNPQTPSNVLEILANDNVESVSKRAKKTIKKIARECEYHYV